MDSTNYTNLRINFKLNCNNFNKEQRFEKVTLGNNKYIIVDSTFRKCITENNKLHNFNKGGCQIFNEQFNGFKPNESSYTSRVYKGISTKFHRKI